MTFLALDNVQMNFDLIGWQIAMYRSTVKAVNDNADKKMKHLKILKWQQSYFVASFMKFPICIAHHIYIKKRGIVIFQ